MKDHEPGDGEMQPAKSLEAEVLRVINRFEAEAINESQALHRLSELTGKAIGEDGISSYELNNYWRSCSGQEWARRLAIREISDWQNLDEAGALKLIREIQERVTDDALLERNEQALAKRFRKSNVLDLVFQEDLTAEEILAELKRDTVIYL